MSIRLKPVKWKPDGLSYFADILGLGIMVFSAPEGYYGQVGGEYVNEDGLDTLEAAKSACEQHALERIRKAVEVVPDHIGDGNEMVGWQDISTAPRDGLYPILICGGTYQTDGQIHGLSVDDRVIVSRFVHRLNKGDSPWMDMCCPAVSILNPTHWMPLPKPPKEVGE